MPTPLVLRVFLLFIISYFYTNVSGQILDYSTYVKIENGKKITRTSLSIKINDLDSRWVSSIKIPHDAKDEFKLIEAYIEDSFGNVVRKIKKKDISTRNNLSYSTFYQDDLVEEFDMYWNSLPYVINYSFEISESNYLALAYWNPQVYSQAKVINGKLEVEVPENYMIHVENGESLKFSELNLENKKILKWECKNFIPPTSEIQMPHSFELLPLVYVASDEFNYGIKGSSKSWEDFSKWKHELNKDNYELTIEEKFIVSKIIANKKDNKEIARALYHYLQDNTTYINVAIDVGGLKSYPASYVCKNKYGDCKALTTYMKALLQFANIDSYYCSVYGDESVKRINKNIPNQQFNHIILMVPLENDTIWLENTSDYLPFNYLGTFTQNRLVLPSMEKDGHLIKTPALSSKENSVVSNYNISSAIDGKGTFAINKIFRGSSFEDFCSLNKNYSKEEITPEIANQVPFKKSKIDDWNLSQMHRDSTFISVDIKGEFENLFRKIGNILVLNLIQYDLPNYEKPEDRKYPLRINRPLAIIDSINYELIDNDRKVKLPDNILLESPFGYYRVNYLLENNSIKVTNQLIINRGEYAGEDYRRYYNFIQEIKNYQKKSSIILTKEHEN